MSKQEGCELNPGPSLESILNKGAIQFSSVAQLCPTLCDPMDCSTPGLPVHHQLPEFIQTHVCWVGHAIQLFHPLSSLLLLPSTFPSIRVFSNVSSSHPVAEVLQFQLQHQSFQWIFRVDFLWDGLVGSPCSPRDSQESSPTPQFKSINSLTLSFLYGPTHTSIHDHWKNHSFDWTDHSGLRWTSGVVVSLLKWKSSHAILPRLCSDSPFDPGNKPRSLQSGCPAGTYNTFSKPAGPAPLSSLTTVTSLWLLSSGSFICLETPADVCLVHSLPAFESQTDGPLAGLPFPPHPAVPLSRILLPIFFFPWRRVTFSHTVLVTYMCLWSIFLLDSKLHKVQDLYVLLLIDFCCCCLVAKYCQTLLPPRGL